MAKTTGSAPSRTSYAAVALEIRRALTERRPPGRKDQVQQKELADLLGISEGQVSRKINPSSKRPARFDVDEIGKIAALFDAPPGWPILPWSLAERAFKGTKELAEENARLQDELEELRRQLHSATHKGKTRD